MEPQIVEMAPKKFVGKRLKMSFVDNKTGELWGGFIPRRREIANSLSSNLFSLQIYSLGYFDEFDPSRDFEKWALIEVSDFSSVPTEMETLGCPGGMYAVFFYKGTSSDTSIFQYILATWLPSSRYKLDDRPHFEVLGEKYQNGDPESEEEIWIPIRLR